MLDPNKVVPNLDGRQHSDWLFVEISLANFVANSNEVDVQLPLRSEVIEGFVNVDQAFDTGTTDTISIGDAGSATRYHAAIDLKTAARTALTPTGYQYNSTNGNTIKIVRTPVGTAATVGSVRVAIEYIQLGEADSTQG